MALPQSILGYGIKFESSSYTLRVRGVAGVSDLTEDLDFPASGSLDTNKHYHMICRNGDSLLDLLRDCLVSHTNIDDVLLYIDSSDGFKIKLRYEHQDRIIELFWGHANTTLDAYIFGFLPETYGNSADASQLISSDYAPFGFIRMERPPNVDSRRNPRFIGGVSQSISGKMRTTNIASDRERTRSLNYTLLEASKCRIEDNDREQDTLEHAFVEGWSEGSTVRYIEDESNINAARSFRDYRFNNTQFPINRNGQYNVLFDFSMSGGVEDSAGRPTAIGSSALSGGTVVQHNMIDAVTMSGFTFSIWIDVASYGAGSTFRIGTGTDFDFTASGFGWESLGNEAIVAATATGWTHFALTYDTTNSWRGYVDGVEATVTESGTIPTAYDFFDSVQIVKNSRWDAMADAAIFSEAMTPEQVYQLYSGRRDALDVSSLLEMFTLDNTLHGEKGSVLKPNAVVTFTTSVRS